MEHKATRDPNNPRDFLDVYLAEMERKENPSFDQEALELTCLDLFKVNIITVLFVLSLLKCDFINEKRREQRRHQQHCFGEFFLILLHIKRKK